MTEELYFASEVIELEPQGRRCGCRCGAVIDWSFWPQILNLECGCIEDPTRLCGTRAKPGPYAGQTLIWAYCGECKRFYGGIFKSS